MATNEYNFCSHSRGICSSSSPRRPQTPTSSFACPFAALVMPFQLRVANAACLECSTTLNSCHMHARMKTRRARAAAIAPLSSSIAGVSLYAKTCQLTCYKLVDLLLVVRLLRAPELRDLGLPRLDALPQRVDVVSR